MCPKSWRCSQSFNLCHISPIAALKLSKTCRSIKMQRASCQPGLIYPRLGYHRRKSSTCPYPRFKTRARLFTNRPRGHSRRCSAGKVSNRSKTEATSSTRLRCFARHEVQYSGMSLRSRVWIRMIMASPLLLLSSITISERKIVLLL